jgi:uncharacterized protein (UPF0332 family)
MDPHDFLTLAGALTTGTAEADWRSAVSRAYYAAFHVARLLLRQGGFAVPRAERAHAYLFLRLSNSGHPLVEQAGVNLNSLRSTRNRADYDLDRPFDEQTAIDNFQLADDVIRLLDQVPTVPTTMSAIVDRMRVYERDVLGEVTWQAPPP